AGRALRPRPESPSNMVLLGVHAARARRGGTDKADNMLGQVLGTGPGFPRAPQGRSKNSSNRAAKPHERAETSSYCAAADLSTDASASMVRRGSTVRVRQRARKSLQLSDSCCLC